jgi:hypothetical protein
MKAIWRASVPWPSAPGRVSLRRRLFRKPGHGVRAAPQTIMAVKFADEALPARFGYPFKVRIPTKLGYKNPKWVTTIFVTNHMPGGFREDRGYNWFGGSW